MSDTDTEPRVLVVDDEREVADAYALRLRNVCSVMTAYGGREALTAVDDRVVDVVLLDRHMPDISGDDVLATLRDREFAGRVVMVTAVDPDVNVVDLPFDDYLCKPIDRADVRSVVDQQRQILAYETLGEYFRVKSTELVLSAQTPSGEPADSGEREAIRKEADRLERRVRRLLDDETVVTEFEAVDRTLA